MKNFKNETKLNRTAHDENNFYTCVSNQLIKDERLTIIEVGIMVKLLSNSDGWIFNSSYFKTTLGIGKDLYFKSIKHLVELGYINKIRYQGGVRWIINETPNFINPDISTIEISTTENTPLISNKEINKKKISNKEINNNITGTSTGAIGNFEDVENSIKKEESTEKLTETKIPVAISTEKTNIESSTVNAVNEVTATKKEIDIPTPTAGRIFSNPTGDAYINNVINSNFTPEEKTEKIFRREMAISKFGIVLKKW